MAADDFAANTTTGRLTLASPASGNLETSGDEDWFKITLEAGINYKFNLKEVAYTQASGNITYYSRSTLLLMDTSGSLLGSRETSGSNASIGYTPAIAGTYYVGVKGLDGITGTYELDAVRYSDDYSAATNTTGVLTVGGTVQGSLASPVEDADWFKVTLNANSKYSFDVNRNGTTSSLPPFTALQIMDASGKAVSGGHSETFGTSAQLVFGPQVSGTYYLQIKGTQAGEDATYTARLSMAGSDDYGNSTGNAGALSLGAEVTGKLEIADDTDWFKVNLEKGVNYQFGATTSFENLIVGLYDADGKRTEVDLYGSGLKSYVPAISGPYYVSVSALYYATGNYAVGLQTDDFTATTQTSGELANGAPVTGKLELPGDRDWFKISLQAGVAYSFKESDVASTGSGSQVVTRLAFHNEAGNVLSEAFRTGTSPEFVSWFTPEKSGTYFVSVAGDSNSKGSYQISANTAPADDYADDSTTTARVTASAPLQGKLETPADNDWAGIAITAEHTYSLEVTGAADDGAAMLLYATLKSGTGNERLTVQTLPDTASGGPRLAFHTADTGLIFLHIGNFSSKTGTYTVTLADHGKDDYGQQDRPGQLQQGTLLNGKIDFAGDKDWMKIALKAGTLYRFFMESPDLTSGQLELIRDDNMPSMSGTIELKAGTASSLDFLPTTSGDYYLSIAGPSLSTGSYSILAGHFASDTQSMFGTEGKDTFIHTHDGNAFYGYGGLDTVRYSESRSLFTLHKTPGYHNVSRIASDQAMDTLGGIERVEFSDGAIALDINGTAGQAYRLYRAAFDRTPDETGIGYWIAMMDKGLSLTDAAHHFMASEEFALKYGTSTSNSQFVDILYKNVLHRAPDADGRSYWIDVLDKGHAREAVLASFSESPENQTGVAATIGIGFAYQPY